MSDDNRIRTGDFVRPKKGGPTMIVRGPKPDDRVQCEWFGEGNELCTGSFARDELEPAIRQTRGASHAA
jgi:uncharacterized protein YodC (DUF2158 family)